MELPDVFDAIRPSIVAFGSKIAKGRDGAPPLMPPLLGTGFVVHPDGVAATNRHVADALRDLPRHPTTGEFAGFALVFSGVKEDPDGGLGLDAHFVDIYGAQVLSEFAPEAQFYGAPTPDIAFIQLKIHGLPAVKLATDDWSIRVGMSVATAGFPLGEDPLIANGILGQGTPLLRRGIVSAVNPFPCPQPHGFSIDVMSQGGASGSPIFRTDAPEVLGLLYAGFPGTNITLAVPSLIVSDIFDVFMNEHFEQLSGIKSLSDLTGSGAIPRTTGFLPSDWGAV